MRITSIEKLMNNTSDQELLDIYIEVESGKVTSTSYAHDFCRKVNKMIDDGKLSVKQDGFRHIYLPSLRKLVYKEMARRYAMFLYDYKAPTQHSDTPDVTDGEICRCDWCGNDFDRTELIRTDYGMLCSTCIEELQSRDEPVTVYR